MKWGRSHRGFVGPDRQEERFNAKRISQATGKTVTVTGEVTRFIWRNLHMAIRDNQHGRQGRWGRDRTVED